MLILSFCSSNAGMKTSAPLSMPSSITANYTPTHASNRCRLKSFTSCAFYGRLAAPDFVMKYTEANSSLEWTQVSVALGAFVALCSIRRWVSWIFLVWGFAGHGDQGGCAMCFQADVLLGILRVHVSR